MATKIVNSQETFGWKVKDARPIDDRQMFVTKQDLIDYTAPMYTTLYDGLVVHVDENDTYYKWVENQYGLLPLPFGYKSYDVNLGGLDYSNKEYNWVVYMSSMWRVFVKEDDYDFISFLFSELPHSQVQNRALTAELFVGGEIEVTLPDSIVWDESGFIKIMLFPAIPAGTAIKIKLS